MVFCKTMNIDNPWNKTKYSLICTKGVENFFFQLLKKVPKTQVFSQFRAEGGNGGRCPGWSAPMPE